MAEEEGNLEEGNSAVALDSGRNDTGTAGLRVTVCVAVDEVVAEVVDGDFSLSVSTTKLGRFGVPRPEVSKVPSTDWTYHRSLRHRTRHPLWYYCKLIEKIPFWLREGVAVVEC